jgi:hypothetical protein
VGAYEYSNIAHLFVPSLVVISRFGIPMVSRTTIAEIDILPENFWFYECAMIEAIEEVVKIKTRRTGVGL